MSEVGNKLRLMIAAPHMAAAIEKVLPLVRRKAGELALVAYALPGDMTVQREADQWLEAAMLLELALKDAQPKTDNVIPMRPAVIQ